MAPLDDLKADEALLAPFREKLETLKSDVKKYDVAEVEALAASHDDMGRFLIARNNDLDKAFSMAQAALQWRSKFKPKDITVKDFPTAHAQGVWRLAGRTKDGCGIIHITAANWSSFAYSVDEYVKMVAFHIEQSLAQNPEGSKTFLILDMRNMGYFTDMRKLRSLARILSDYYPERLSMSVFVNCDWVFDKLCHICVRWVDKRTAEKTIDFRDNASELLLQHIDAHQLTKDLGGTREEEWPMQPVE